MLDDVQPFVTLTPEEGHKLIDELIRGASNSADADRILFGLGTLIDLSETFGRLDGIEAAIAQGNKLLKATIDNSVSSTVHYFLANAWEGARLIRRKGSLLHEWEQPELDKQIIHLRNAVLFGERAEIIPRRRCEILTNLGNLMSHCGRIVDAIGYWDRALAVDRDFMMAAGNRGMGLMRYAEFVHDPGHQVFHLREAHRELNRALSAPFNQAIPPDARDAFAERFLYLVRAVPEKVFEPLSHCHDFKKGRSKAELRYRQWCLRERLFLNDLNELGDDPYAAADVLTLPGLHTTLDAPRPNAIGFFNQLKQEYVSARYLYYEGLMTNRPHWSDRQVTLINTLDYPAYGLGIEKIQTAFRVAYSLLDKVGYLLNDYFQLGIPEKSVSFRGLWYNDQRPKRGLRKEIQDKGNAPLQALYWLAKDLFEKNKDFAEALEPEARELADIRNHLEHKYLKLHSEWAPVKGNELRWDRGDSLAYSLGRRDFAGKTIHLLRIARAALIYLSFAIHVEERTRSKGLKGLVGPITMHTWEDDWKF